MKTTTLNRTVMAALMGTALTFGWGAPATARAQDGTAQQDGKPSDQKTAQYGEQAEEQERRNARELRKGQDDAKAAAMEAARVQEQAQARQRDNRQRQYEQQVQVEQKRDYNQQRQYEQQVQVEQKRDYNQQRQYDQQREVEQKRDYNQQRQLEQQARWGSNDYGRKDEPVARTQPRAPQTSKGGAFDDIPSSDYPSGKGSQYGQVPYPSGKGTYPADGSKGYRDQERSRQKLIEEQRLQAEAFARQREQRRYDADRWSRNLLSQNRSSGYRYQQDYWSRLSRQRYDWQNYDYYSDPYFYSAPSYRYYRGGNSYYINDYAANLLRQAINYGYREGIRAGRADRYDGWRFSYRDAYAYQDASYGYRGMYVDYDDYSYYFREGFRRGYEDGYYDNRRYGRYYNGSDDILQTVLSLILDLRPYR